jgi:hypothetical protein
MQRIKAEEEKEKKELPKKVKEQKEVLYCLDKFDWLIERPKFWTDKTKNTFFHQTAFTSAFVMGIFRPPKFVTV